MLASSPVAGPIASAKAAFSYPEAASLLFTSETGNGKTEVYNVNARFRCSLWKDAMKTAAISRIGGTQTVKLPDEFHFEGDTVSIRREGEAVILEPLKPASWPPGFFDRIGIDDPAFMRPDQGQVPPAPPFE